MRERLTRSTESLNELSRDNDGEGSLAAAPTSECAAPVDAPNDIALDKNLEVEAGTGES
jgi:hypothetical protein